MISDLSARLTSIDASDIGAEIQQVLVKLLAAVDADRVCWYAVPPGMIALVRLCSVAKRVAELPLIVRFDEMPYLTAALARGERIILRRLQDLPKDAVEDRRSLEVTGVKSLALLPTGSCAKDMGVLGVYLFSGHREWTKDLVSQLAVLANLVGASLARAQVEQARQESESRFRCLFEQALLGIALETLAGKLIHVNPAFCSLLGYAGAELLTLSCVQLTHPDDVNRERPLFAELQEGVRSSYEIEKRFVRKDGAVVWVHATVSLLKAEDGSPLITCMVNDITGQKNAERQMQASCWTLLRSTLDAVPVQIAILDNSGRIIAVNAAWQGLADSEGMKYSLYGIGANFFEVCAAPPGEDFKPSRTVMERLRRLLRGEAVADELLEKRRTETSKEVWYQITMVRFEEGGSPRVVLSYRDVTDLVRAREALARNQEHLSLALEASHAGTWDWNLSAGELRWSIEGNPDLVHPCSGENDYAELMNSVYPEDRARLADAANKALLGESPFSCEFRVRTRGLAHQESLRWLFVKGRPNLDEAGRAVRVLGAYVDITDLKRTDAVLHDLAGRIIQAQEDDRRRISRELHDDVGQRLSLLSLEVDLLARSVPESSEVQLRLTSLLAKMDDLATDIHQLSHELHSTQLQHLGLKAALNELCRRTSEQLGIAMDLNASALSQAIPPSVALCLFRISQEGLNNIVKHSKAKRASVELGESHGVVRLRIRDCGIGFDPAHPPSRGIGLASMRERLRIVGGTLAITSQPGKGTELTAEVRLAQLSIAEQASDSPQLRSPSQGELLEEAPPAP